MPGIPVAEPPPPSATVGAAAADVWLLLAPAPPADAVWLLAAMAAGGIPLAGAVDFTIKNFSTLLFYYLLYIFIRRYRLDSLIG